MAIRITDDCINCGNCEMKCPNKAIYEGGQVWSFSYGGTAYLINDGRVVGSEDKQAPLSESVYYIVPDKCTECVGFHDEPQCVSVCPVDCCIPDEKFRETRDELENKKRRVQIR